MVAKPLLTPFKMQDKRIRILSTRPLAKTLIAQAVQQNIIIDQETFIEIRKNITPETFDRIEKLTKQSVTVVFTSMNAVEVLVDYLKDLSKIPDWKIYCMGGATSSLVKKYWLNDAVFGNAKNASELALEIIADKQVEVNFFCGNKRREELPALLHENGISVNELMVYETLELTKKIKQEYDAILFFSPSAVHSFFQKNKITDNTVLFAIGSTTAETIKSFCSNKIVLSNFPDKEQMVEQVVKMMGKL